MREFNVNEFITLKLEVDKTFIYVNNRQFQQYIRLVLNITTNFKQIFDRIDSNNETSEVYKIYLYQGNIVKGENAVPAKNQTHSILVEEEFWGYCSNLQVWAENDYIYLQPYIPQRIKIK